MKHSTDNDSYQWIKFMEHWGLTGMGLLVVLSMPVMMFFINLDGLLWMGFVAAGFGMMLFSAGLIAHAKFPAYRQGRFFSFGVRTIPRSRVPAYLWGWRLFMTGLLLTLHLIFLSRGGR